MVLSWIDEMLDRIGRSLPRFGSSPRNWRAREFALLRRKARHSDGLHKGQKQKRWRPWFAGLGRSMGRLGRSANGAHPQSARTAHSAQSVRGQRPNHGYQNGVATQGTTHAPASAHANPDVIAHTGQMAFAAGHAVAQPGQFAPFSGTRKQGVRDPVRDRVFRRARRHSVMVRSLRYGLPVIALGLLATLPLSAVTPTFPGLGSLSLDGIGFSGTTIVMENPRLNGFEQGRGGYQFEAERAEQDVTESNKVKLTGLSGRITQEDGRWASIRARQGLVDTDAETMLLERDIIVRAEGGYRAFMQSADVELKDGNVRSDMPVQVDMLNGSVKAQSLELIERGRYILFDGDVKMTIYLGAVQEAGGSASASDGANSEAPQAVPSAAQ
jgi:lipopolysaccharide export system protein LptC